ncbi:MAG: hypothetical protein ND866_03380 [Pyrinomonadaceae bacterium]|nr:hypothetical protein [Pyrinomonadaceae bacterium]
MNHSKPQNNNLGNQKRLVSQASRVALLLAFLAAALFFTTKPFSVEGKKLRAAQGKSGVQVHRIKVEGVTSAVVNFEELARQQALNPGVSDPSPRAIAPPKTIEEVEGETGEAEAPNLAAQVDIPSPLIPSPAPATNFAGLNDIPFAPPGTAFFTIPPDTTGAVSPDSVNRVFTTLNNNYRIQDKTGTQIGSDVSMTNFWAPTGAVSPFDPRVQYDPYNDRWILTGVSNAQSANTSILVGISQTSDPGGSYFLFRIPARIATDLAATNFADFPMLGFNKNWVVVSINMFSTVFVDGRSLVIDYPTLRTGVFAATYFTGVSAANAGFCMHPATTYSSTEATEFLVAHQSSAGATYRMHTITGTPAAPVFTIGVLKTRPGGGWTQPGGNQLPQAMGTCATTPLRMESGDAFVRSNVVFRNGTIWYPQTVGLPAGVLTHTAVQWTQLDNAGNVLQGGRVEDPTATATNGGKWYAYSSIAVNASNDVLLGFSEFESDGFADAGYTYRDHADAAGTMRDPVIYKAGEDCYSKDFSSGRNRWGDFSHTMVDPTDDCSFWTIQEYAKLQAPPVVGGSSSKWGTWWARVNAVSSCATLVAATGSLVTESCVPANSQIDPGERVTVHLQVTNNGPGPAVNVVGTLQSSGGALYPSAPKNYGTIAAGATVGRDFTFTADPALSPGNPITATLQTNFDNVTYTFTAGPTPCGLVRLVTTSSLTCTSPSTVQASITVSNIGTLPANSVSLTLAKLGSTDGTPLPQALGNIGPGSSVNTTVTFASSGGSTLALGGTYTGGTFSSTKRVSISCSPASPSKY